MGKKDEMQNEDYIVIWEIYDNVHGEVVDDGYTTEYEAVKYRDRHFDERDRFIVRAYREYADGEIVYGA